LPDGTWREHKDPDYWNTGIMERWINGFIMRRMKNRRFCFFNFPAFHHSNFPIVHWQLITFQLASRPLVSGHFFLTPLGPSAILCRKKK
jgi:hypothetical protein